MSFHKCVYLDLTFSTVKFTKSDKTLHIEAKVLYENTPMQYILKAKSNFTLSIMPPTLKKLMGILLLERAWVGACVRGWVTLFVPTVTFKLLN